MNLWKLLFPRRGRYHPRSEPRYDMPVTSENVSKVFESCGDFQMLTVLLGGRDKLQPSLCFIDGIVDSNVINRDVMFPLTSEERFGEVKSSAEAVQLMSEGIITNYTINVRRDMDSLVTDILSGFCAVIVDSESCAVTFETKGGERRSVSEAQTEKSVKGARDSFVEVLRTNTGLIRRRMRNADLKIVEQVVGRRTLTKVGVLYIEGLTNSEMVQELKAKINAMDVDGVLTAATLEEYLVEHYATPFPQLQSTERPDKLCIGLLEGRAAVLVDGLPLGFLVPGTLSEYVKVPDDLSTHFLVTSGLTVLRYISILISVLLPAAYVAITMYHQEIMPTRLMLSIIESKQEVPFTTAAEVLGMLVAFELLQEASLRLPQNIGQTMGIIGALIVGQSAVEAKVISPVVVIVVAVAGITGYTMPNQDLSAAFRLCRFLMVLMALAMGLYGMVLGGILLVWHLSKLENYGVPYLWPFVGGNAREISKALFRWPMKENKYRKKALGVENMRERK